MENKKNILKAISEFQQEVPVIHKDTQGFGYTYADLPKIFEVINPLLKKHGLGFTQPLEGNIRRNAGKRDRYTARSGFKRNE